MDEMVKKAVLRMIPYGLYILTAADEDDNIAAAGINWLMQASFQPPLVAVGVKVDSYIHQLISGSKAFAINLLEKGQEKTAFTFFKPAERKGYTIGGEPFHLGSTGSPILENMPAHFECEVVGRVDEGDHTVFVGEVVAVGLSKEIKGRPDETTLWLRDLGGNIFYGG
jgi:flavin reductase (DIM6/NTAB) family NADH-FMN oxidoreductase RutF